MGGDPAATKKRAAAFTVAVDADDGCATMRSVVAVFAARSGSTVDHCGRNNGKNSGERKIENCGDGWGNDAATLGLGRS